MIRTILILAVALLIWRPLFVTPAAACISCNYTPEVAKSPHPGGKARKRAVKERPARKRAPARQIAVPKKDRGQNNVAAKETAAPVKDAAADAAAQDVAKQEPVETYTASKKPSAAPADPVDEQSDTRPSMQASTATPSPAAGASDTAKPIEEAKAPGELGCKKFIPTAGITISVACE
jgi:hypothetical protein